LKSLEVRAPQPASSKSDEQFWVVRKVAVEQGQYVEAGALLCILADHSELYVEGTAYTQDSPALEQAIKNKQEVAAVIETGDKQPELVEGLKILYAANQVDEQTRVCHFYVPLPNQITSNHETDEGHRFVAWRFKPGQRLKVRVVIDRLPNRIVLPSQAVVEDGAESYVFQRFGDHFDRKPVQVEYRDPYSVVIAQNGGIKPGDIVASSGAAQLQLALKNKSGAGVDPHAGHTH
jgi:cobalt-zinc-cadmium efflux system membrane fusion protein